MKLNNLTEARYRGSAGPFYTIFDPAHEKYIYFTNTARRTNLTTKIQLFDTPEEAQNKVEESKKPWMDPQQLHEIDQWVIIRLTGYLM